jgi:regulator of RNase E activity RraA
MQSKLRDKIRNIPTASLSDALDGLGIRGFMDHAIRSRTIEAKIVGPAVTVKDKLSKTRTPPIKALEAIEKAHEGDVFVRVIEGASEAEVCSIGLFGGIMGLGSKMKGLAGAVIDAGARDIIECAEMGFPVFSRSVVPTTSIGRTEVVGLNVPVKCGGITVKPRDIIVGDQDGVVVIPKDKLNAVLEAATEIDDREKKVSLELKKGTPVTEAVKKFSRI